MTSYGPFAEFTPRGQIGWIHDQWRPVPEHLRMMLGHLDGVEKYSYSIWRGNDPDSIVGFDPADESGFAQAAGSAESMTVEARLLGADGDYHLYTVGRPEPADGTTTLIPINGTRAVRVFSNEIFTADEAALIFHTYYLTDTVSQPYVLRELDLSHELSELR